MLINDLTLANKVVKDLSKDLSIAIKALRAVQFEERETDCLTSYVRDIVDNTLEYLDKDNKIK